MVEILKTLKDTPLPSILVIGGILFLLLSFIRKVGSNIELEPEKKWMVGFIGIILLCSGVGLYLIPAMQTPLAIIPTETLLAQATTEVLPSSTASNSPTQTPKLSTFTTPPTLTSVLPTPIQPPTLSYAEKLCPFGITRSEVNSLNIGLADVSTVQSYINSFDAGRPNDGGAFVKGTKIPADVVIATNFDEVNPNKWLEYPVIALVHSGSWGLFQSTGEYTAPNAGACRVIIP
jgi:hypothetical protein